MRGYPADYKERVLELRREGLSFRMIARELALTPGQVSGVVGRARKRGDNLPSAPTLRLAPTLRQRIEVPKDEPLPVGPIGTAPPFRFCQYMAGPFQPGWQMCGALGFPWCAYHRAKCYASVAKVAA